MAEQVKKSPIVILKEYFGFKQGQTLKEFSEEVKKLPESDKEELVVLAAKELGVGIQGR